MIIQEALRELREEMSVDDFTKQASKEYGLVHYAWSKWLLPLENITKSDWYTDVFKHGSFWVPVYIDSKSVDGREWPHMNLPLCFFNLKFNLSKSEYIKETYGLPIDDMINITETLFYDSRFSDTEESKTMLKKKRMLEKKYDFEDNLLDTNLTNPCIEFSCGFEVDSRNWKAKVYVCPKRNTIYIIVSCDSLFDPPYPLNMKILIDQLKKCIDLKNRPEIATWGTKIKKLMMELKDLGIYVGPKLTATFDIED